MGREPSRISGCAIAAFALPEFAGIQHGIHRRAQNSRRASQGWSATSRPARRVLRIDTDIALVHVVEKGVREKLALERVGQTDIDVVITGLQPEHRFGRQRAERPVDRARALAAARDAIVGLMELIAEDRVGGEVGEVVKEIELAFDQHRHCIPHAVIVGLRQSRGQRKRLVSPPSVGSISSNNPSCPVVMARSGTWSVEFQLLA